jgi:hypothetical protein
MPVDFRSASSRHWDNSRFLADNNRWQEAAYLAGYAAECALKALVEQGGLLGRSFSHDLAKLSDDGVAMALLLNPLLRRYPVEPIAANLPGLSTWSETHRYEATGFLPESDLQQIVAAANHMAELILTGLILDRLFEDVPL